jgi:carboxyl-terminal processing protease
MLYTFRHPIRWFAVSALGLLLLAGGSTTTAPAAAPTVLPPGAVAPAERQRLLARRIGAILEEAHYSRSSIDDRMSQEVFRHFIEILDSQRSYFLASDIDEFQQYRDRFDDMIKSGQIEPAFVIFDRFQQRRRDTIRYAIDLLAVEPDFTLKESFEFERAKAPWAANVAELNELWRLRVKNDAIALLLAGKNWTETADLLRKRYEGAQKRGDKTTADDVFELLMNSYARSFDPHSNYFGARNSEDYRIQMSLSYEGIGATLNTSDDYTSIVSLSPGGPAATAGTINVNDRITAVAQGRDGPFQEVIGWRADDVVQLIRGKGGSLVRLQLLPAGAAPGSPEKVVELTRGKVTLEGQASKKERRTVERNGRKLSVGVITVPSFYRDIDAQNRGDKDYRSTTRDVRRLIDELQKEGPVDGLILDLRGDGGGLLPEATELTGLFIDRGPVVQVKDTTGRVEVLEDPTPGKTAWDGPLVVLVDRFSASASEIFAAAIQDYQRGYIVGQNTFGKGTVQNLIPLDRWSQRPVDGQLTVTIGKFYRVTGESTQHRGVQPDISLPSPISLKDVGESSLDAALPWDRIAPASFKPLPRATTLPTANMLDKSESERGQADPDYQWYLTSIAATEQVRAQTSLSLNLEQRKQERETLDAERLGRENVRRTRQNQSPFPTLQAVDDEYNELVKKNAQLDVPLDQTAQILADIILSATPQRGRTITASGR